MRVPVLPTVLLVGSTACHDEHPSSTVEPHGPCDLSPDAAVPAAEDQAIEVGTFAFALPAGGLTEIPVELGVDGQVWARFEAVGAAVAWDVHSHDGDRVITHVEGMGTADLIAFEATEAGLYSVTWWGHGPVDAQVCTAIFVAGDAMLQP
jgi:hypothetical protein